MTDRQWIKFTDQQPRIGQNIIAVGTWHGEITGTGCDDYMGIGSWNGTAVCIDSDTISTFIVDPTHWMQLPEWPNQ